MARPDLNLLVTLDVLLAEGSVARAARRLRLSPSAMSRTLARLREGMHSFALPLPIAQITVSLLWHPRLDGDPAHRWLRGCVRDACAEPLDDPLPATAPEMG